jgi:hypothetical protein
MNAVKEEKIMKATTKIFVAREGEKNLPQRILSDIDKVIG